ncbi:MAG: hypothetical protein ABIH88_02220 [Patescibacteria group bacterium]
MKGEKMQAQAATLPAMAKPFTPVWVSVRVFCNSCGYDRTVVLENIDSRERNIRVDKKKEELAEEHATAGCKKQHCTLVD